MKKYEFDIREVDAIAYDEGYVWNTSYHLGTMKTAAKDEKRAFLSWLKRNGIRFRPGTIRVEFDGDVYEVVERKTGCPLFAAVPAL